MEVREHKTVSEKQLRQPFYYSHWFFCAEAACQTKQVMPDRYRVWNWTGEKRARLEARMSGTSPEIQQGLASGGPPDDGEDIPERLPWWATEEKNEQAAEIFSR